MEKSEGLSSVGGDVTCTSAMDNNMEVPQKIRHKIKYLAILECLAIPVLDVYSKELKAGSQRYLHAHVYSSSIPVSLDG